MGHENGGWMNSDQRDAVKDQAREKGKTQMDRPGTSSLVANLVDIAVRVSASTDSKTLPSLLAIRFTELLRQHRRSGEEIAAGVTMGTFAEQVANEIAKARSGHMPLNSAHEAYSVILEEVCEFWDQVRLKRELRDQSNMLKELVQIGAMAQRAAEDLGLISSEKGGA